jgi:hypothetical protein
MAACLDQWRQSIIDCDDTGLLDQVRDIESVSGMLHSVMLTAATDGSAWKDSSNPNTAQRSDP